MIESALARLLDGKDLTRAEARSVMDTIMTGGATPAQIGGFLVALGSKARRPTRSQARRRRCATM